MSYTYICPTCLARQGAPMGGKLVSQEIGGYLTWASPPGRVRRITPAPRTAIITRKQLWNSARKDSRVHVVLGVSTCLGPPGFRRPVCANVLYASAISQSFAYVG
jgi:hypothetical protein